MNDMGVSWVIGVPPVIIYILVGFSLTKTNHFGDPPFMETPIYIYITYIYIEVKVEVELQL